MLMSAVWGERKGRQDVFLQFLPFLSNQVAAIKEYHFPQKLTLTQKPNLLTVFCIQRQKAEEIMSGRSGHWIRDGYYLVSQ